MSTTEELTKTEILKQYLLEKDNAYLLDDNNNGKTIMLSGAWGSGKTHFWQHEIEPELKNKLKDKACVYVSLYGKDNLDSLKKEILINASSIDNLLSKEVSSFGFDVLSSIKDSDMKIGQLFKAFSDATDSGKSSQGIEQLKNGGIICFDDFERKSDKINLNDLFGFISQLSIDLKCKTIIILNSEVFKGKDAETFSNVKEKTISKFFYFAPSIEELFKSISNNPKYNKINNYKTYILSVIKETEELNARLYIQALDNCLEWLNVKKNIDSKIIRVLILSTFNFILHHVSLDYKNIIFNTNGIAILRYTHIPLLEFIYQTYGYIHNATNKEEYCIKSNLISCETFIQDILRSITFSDKNGKSKFTDKAQEEYLNWLMINKSNLCALLKYGHSLYYVSDVEESTYTEITTFITTGILLP